MAGSRIFGAWVRCGVLCCTGISAGAVYGADTWVGGAPILGDTTLWTAPGNWRSGAVPPDGSDLNFGSGFASGLNINIFGNRNVSSLNIEASAAFNLIDSGAGGILTIQSKVTRTQTSSGTQTISAPVYIPGDEFWRLSGTGELALTGMVFSDEFCGITVDGGGNLFLGADGVQSYLYHLKASAANITLGAGTLRLSSTVRGADLIALYVGSPGAAAIFTVQGGATLNNSGPGGAVIDGVMTVTGTDTKWTSGFYTSIGSMQAGALTIESNASVVAGPSNADFLIGGGANGALTVKSDATLAIGSGIIAYGQGKFALATVTGTGSQWNNSASLDLGGFLDADGAVTGVAGTIVNGGTATLNISDGAVVSAPRTTIWNSSGSIMIDGGTLATGSLIGQGTVTLQADPSGGSALAINNPDAKGNQSFFGTISGAGTLVKTGASRQLLTGQNDIGGLIINGGTIALASENKVGKLRIAGTPDAPSAQLEIQSATLLIAHDIDDTATSTSNTDALAVTRSLIAAGLSGGNFAANGIFSTYANDHRNYRLAYERVIDRKNDGGRIDPAAPLEAILLYNTLAGDANMDNTVGFADLVRVAQHYGQSGKFWNDGDFNYDGKVDFADLVAVAQNYGAGLPSAPVPGASVDFDADMARAFAAVPEPGSMMLAGIAAGFVFARRRRSNL